MYKTRGDITWGMALENQNLSDNALQVWKITLPLDNPIFNRLKMCLSDDEIQKARKFYSESDQKRFIATRGVLRELIAAYQKIHTNNIHFAHNLYGKPYLKKNLL